MSQNQEVTLHKRGIVAGDRKKDSDAQMSTRSLEFLLVFFFRFLKVLN